MGECAYHYVAAHSLSTNLNSMKLWDEAIILQSLNIRKYASHHVYDGEPNESEKRGKMEGLKRQQRRAYLYPWIARSAKSNTEESYNLIGLRVGNLSISCQLP